MRLVWYVVQIPGFCNDFPRDVTIVPSCRYGGLVVGWLVDMMYRPVVCDDCPRDVTCSYGGLVVGWLI